MSSDKPRLENYLGLARHYARQYQGMLKEYPSLEFQDLYQVCLIALNRACEAFDPSKNVKMEYIAAIWMKQAMVSFLKSKGATVKAPLRKKVASPEETESVYNYSSFTSISIDTPDVDELELIEEDEEDETAQQLVLMNQALEKLSEDDRLLLKLSFGLGNHKKSTYEEIGNELGIEKRAAGQRVNAAKKRLRELMNVEPPPKKKARPQNYKLNNARRSEYYKDYREQNRDLINARNAEQRLKKKETQILKKMVKKMESTTRNKSNGYRIGFRKPKHQEDEQL